MNVKKCRFLENGHFFAKTIIFSWKRRFFVKWKKLWFFWKTRFFFLKTAFLVKWKKLSFSRKRELFFGGDNAFKSTILIYPTFFGADTISCHPVRLRVLYCNRNLSNYCSIFARVVESVCCLQSFSLSQLPKALTNYWFLLKFRQSPALD